MEQANLSDCTFYELFCSTCNSKFRIVLEDESASHHACPECGTSAPVELIGRGKTSQPLPFSQFLHRGRWLAIGQELFLGSPRQRRQQFRATLPEAQRTFAGTR